MERTLKTSNTSFSLQIKTSRAPLYPDIEDPTRFTFKPRRLLLEQDVNYWVHLEKHEGIIEALVQGDLNDIEQQYGDVQETNLDIEMDGDEKSTVRQPLLPRPSVMKELDQLEEKAVNSQVYDAIVHLRRARNTFREAFRQDIQSSTRQLLITELKQRRDQQCTRSFQLIS